MFSLAVRSEGSSPLSSEALPQASQLLYSNYTPPSATRPELVTPARDISRIQHAIISRPVHQPSQTLSKPIFTQLFCHGSPTPLISMSRCSAAYIVTLPHPKCLGPCLSPVRTGLLSILAWYVPGAGLRRAQYIANCESAPGWPSPHMSLFHTLRHHSLLAQCSGVCLGGTLSLCLSCVLLFRLFS